MENKVLAVVVVAPTCDVRIVALAIAIVPSREISLVGPVVFGAGFFLSSGDLAITVESFRCISLDAFF